VGFVLNYLLITTGTPWGFLSPSIFSIKEYGNSVPKNQKEQGSIWFLVFSVFLFFCFSVF
jgi:hypothetical protein